MPRDEAGLSNYFAIIRKKKKFIILIFGAAVLTSAIVSLFSKLSYEVSTTLKIGRVEDQLVMSRPETREVITSNQLLQKTIRTLNLDVSLGKLRKIIKVKDVPSASDLLKVVIRGESPQELTEIAQVLSTFVLEKHQEIFDRRIGITKEEQRQRLEQQKLKEEENRKQKAQLKNLIETTEDNIKWVEERLKNLALTQQEQIDYVLKIDGVRNQLFWLQKEYQVLTRPKRPEKEISQQPSTIFDPAVKPEHPVKEPRIALNIFLAGIVGLIAGIILALLGESVTPVKD